MTQRIWADFNGLFGHVLCISHSDSAPDGHGSRIALHEGMVVTAFMEDFNDDGTRDDLIASGVVQPAPESVSCLGSTWVLRIDEDGVRHQSEIMGDAT